MNKTMCAWTAAAMFAVFAAPAQAQLAAAAPASSASGVKPGPRALTPAEKRDNAAPPPETLPETKAVPQLAIPLNRPGNPPGKPAPVARPASAGAPVNGVADGAARCLAEESGPARDLCQARLAAQKKP